MKKWLCLLLAGALAFSLAACQRSQNVDTPSDATSTNAHTSPSNATEKMENTTSTETTTVNGNPLYLSEPYVYINNENSVIARNKLNALDWETIISIIPATYYEEYPELYGTPLTATLYKDGKPTKLDIYDPRLVRLINFYNNIIHHNLYAYTQGSFNPTALEEIENESFRLVLTYTPIAGSFETAYDTIIVNNKWFVGIQHNIPFGSYPSSAFGRLPFHTDYNWLDVFGF